MYRQKLNKEGRVSSNITICSDVFAVIKEHKKCLEEESIKQADVDHVIGEADNVVEI